MNRMTYELILGIDWLTNWCCLVDLNEGSLNIAGQVIPLRPLQEESFGVVTATPQQIRSQTAKLVEGARLTPGELDKLTEVVKQYQDVFAWSGTKLGRTKILQHQIDTSNAAPIRVAARRIPAQYQEEVHRMIEEMLREEVIKPSTSPWAAPVVLVKKKNGGLRLCVDYRRLNQLKKTGRIPAPTNGRAARITRRFTVV